MTTGTREKLVVAAAELLDDGGTEAVTLREVGRRSGVSHNAPYKHFPSKQALLAAVAARELAQATDGGRRRGDDGALGQLRRLLDGYVTWALAHPARFKLVFSDWSHPTAELADAADTGWAQFVEVVTAAQEEGSLPAGEPQRTASLVRALAHGAVDLAIAGHLAPDGKGRVTPEALVGDLLEHLTDAARRQRV